MKLSFQEKMQWLLLGSLVLVFGLYFAVVLPPASPTVLPNQIFLFGLMVALLVVLLIVGAIVNTLTGPMDELDERDRWISLIATRNGDMVLGVGVLVSLTLAVFTQGNFIFTHVLLAFWVASQITEHASQIVLYRRGR